MASVSDSRIAVVIENDAKVAYSEAMTMRRRLIMIFVVCVCCGLLAWRQGSVVDDFAPDPADEAIWKKLQQPIRLPLDQVTLEEALKRLGKQIQVPIEIPEKPSDRLDPEFDLAIWEATQKKVSFPDVELPAHQLLQLQTQRRGAAVHDGRCLRSASIDIRSAVDYRIPKLWTEHFSLWSHLRFQS